MSNQTPAIPNPQIGTENSGDSKEKIASAQPAPLHPMPESLSETELQMRLEAIKEGEKRSRLAFIVATIVSLSLIIVGWNSYLSWYIPFGMKPGFPADLRKEHLHKELLSQWVKSRSVTIPLLGTQVMI